ncbi:MAG: YndJ family protein, partial [Nannocystaceae bacterium]|nr:YndJ family protein [Nannocystaceae bacterium]
LRLVALDDAAPHWLFTAATWSQLPAAMLLILSFEAERGITAAALAIPWAAVAGVTALYGVQRVLRDGFKPAWKLALNSGLIFVAVGGLWTVASRYGLRPFDFSDTIVLLTGAHFHYAGFILPVLAGLVARANTQRVFDAAAYGVIAAVPLTAVGITLSPPVEVFAALLLATCGFCIAFGQLLVARSAKRSLASLLLALSSLSLMLAMTLATIYAITEFRGARWPQIPDMARWHGTLNALGTCLLGVWAWTLEGPKDPQ